MKKLIFNIFSVALLFALAAGTISAKPTKTRDLASILPASDGVVSLDIQRLTGFTLPQVLSSQPEMLAKINSELDKIKNKSGIDLRQFDRVVIGLSAKKISESEVDLEPILLARGKVSAGAIIALAKLASNGKYREEKIEGKAIFVFSLAEIAKEKKPSVGNGIFDLSLDSMLNKLSQELAVSAYDENTIAIGSLPRVTEAMRKSSTVAPGVLAFSQRKPNAVISFGMNFPDGVASLMKLDNDELGRTLGSVRSIFGAMDFDGANANLSLGAKSIDIDKAKSMQDLLEGLKMLGRSFLGGMKGEERDIYVRLIESAKITRLESEVLLDVAMPQTDINKIIGRK